MTVLQAVKDLLESNWAASISGRSNDVPQPSFVLEKSTSQENLRTRDTGHVTDGGDEVHTPRGFGWTHQKVDYVVTVQLRAADRKTDVGLENGRHRMFGKRENATTQPDRWAGLTGETKRVILDNRKGFAEFDIVADGLTVRDQSDLSGTNHYRADVEIPLTNLADSIDTST